mgnify:CR=1 FL=1
MTEFQLIEKYFSGIEALNPHVELGVGDDCAIVSFPEGVSLCCSMDTMVQGVHFPTNAPADKLAFRALAAATSDLAAMGAEPSHFTLSLTLPNLDEKWLSAFSQGLSSFASLYKMSLVGGDTTRGPLAISVQVHGFVPSGTATRRTGANVGDVLVMTGTIGDAGAALSLLDKEGLNDAECFLLNRYYSPTPRISQGVEMRGVATSSIDISDGLLADAGHLASQSSKKIRIDLDALPLSDEYKLIVGSEECARRKALVSGDDYELLFTLPEVHWNVFDAKAEHSYSKVGVVMQGSGVEACSNGKAVEVGEKGFMHFE